MSPFGKIVGWRITIILLAVVAAVSGLTAYLSAAGRAERMQRGSNLTDGNADLGLAAMERYGCGACHEAEGLPRRGNAIAPPLESLNTRAYIGGVLENKPENLVRWIVNPPAVDPKTAMPNVGVTEADARDIAAYLYSLE